MSAATLEDRRELLRKWDELSERIYRIVVKAVLAELQQADLISSEECKELQHISRVVDVQKGKSPEVMFKTVEVLRRHGFDEESKLLAVLGELGQADLITSEECKKLQVLYNRQRYDMSDVVDVQKGKSPEVMSKTAEVLRRHGFEEESKPLAVLGELRQADLITSEECKKLQVLYNRWRYDMSDVVDVQKGKSPEVMSKTAEVLRRHGFEEESKLLSVLGELQRADLITSKECKWLQVLYNRWRYDMSDVVDVQEGKSPKVMSKSAEVLRRHGFEKESKPLAVLADLRQGALSASESKRLSNIGDVVRLQSGKSPEVMFITADVLQIHGFEEESRILAALANPQHADLITKEECEQMISMSVLQNLQSPEVICRMTEVLRRHGFEKESKLLAVNAVHAELRQADLITSEEYESHISGVVRVQRDKSPEVVFQTADVLKRHGFKEASKLLAGHLPHHAAKVDLHHLVEDEWSRLSSEYHSLKTSVGAVLERLPEQSRLLFRQVYRALSSTARRISKRPKASKLLDARDLRRQIEALHDPELLQQLSSYEEDSLKPFIVNFLDRCRGTGVQPDPSQPDVVLSPSTPAGQVLGFILSRRDYYITDLHIDRQHFSPWDVDTPPPARVSPTLNGPDHFRSLKALITSYANLFTKVVENVETLPRQQYLNLKSFFQYQPHTEVHLSSSRRDVRDCLHRTPLFAPLYTALLRKVVWFLFTREADDLSHKLGDYEKKLVTFVTQFLRACHVEGVVPPTGDMTLHEDGCDLSDPAHLLVCVLELKPYYVGSLHVDESLFTALEREESLEGEGGREENVSMDASPLEPTPPTSESGSSGSFSPPHSKGKGKHRVGTSPSAVPVKRSAQGEGREDEEKEEEEAAGSSAKRRKSEGSHMTGASQSGTGTGTDSGGSDVILSQMVSDRPGYRELFRTCVSRAAARKERALLEALGLENEAIEALFCNNPRNVEEAVHCGLIQWSEGHQGKQPTWEVLLGAMQHAQFAKHHIRGIKKDLGLE